MLTRHSRLSRTQCSEALINLGYGLTANTLQNYASTRRGPPFTRFGNKVFYVWGEVEDWVQSQIVKVNYPAAKQPAEHEHA